MTATTGPEKNKTALVLSAGAPTSPLMAGALAAIYDEGKKFEVIYSAGGGAVIGLLYIAGKGKNPREALRSVVEGMGVHDAIYSLLPIGYKTFFKPGPFTKPIYRWAQNFKMGEFPLGPIPATTNSRRDGFRMFYNAWLESVFGTRHDSKRRFYNDMIDLWANMLTPSNLTSRSQGLCAPFPFLEDMIDFHKLRVFSGDFFMNAYNINKNEMILFDKTEITPAHFRAALAYPSIYPPAEVNGELYFEGADHDPVCFGNIFKAKHVYAEDDNPHTMVDNVKNIVLIDIMASLGPCLVREPRSLLDAYGISIMTPIVALAEKNIRHFEMVDNWHKKDGKPDYNSAPIFNLLKMKFEIPPALQPHVMDWSYSNLTSLWDVGYAAGKNFLKQHGDVLNLANRAGFENQPAASEESID